MVNKDRIVPVEKSDLLSLYGTMLTIANVSFAIIAAADGNFDVTGSGSAGNKLANQPLKSCDFKSGVTGATVYFVADYEFEGFKTAGSASTMGNDSVTVLKDGHTLYKAVLSSGEVTVSAVTPIIS